MKRNIALCFLLASLHPLQAQTYSFKTPESSAPYAIRIVEQGVSCLFPISPRKSPASMFRQVFLNTDLAPFDSVEYTLAGQAKWLAAGEDEKNTVQAFYAKANGVERIEFLVTDKLGTIQTRFSKTAADFSPSFPKPVKNLKNIGLAFLNNPGSGMVLVQPFQWRGSVLQRGRIFSLRTDDGRPLWTSTAPILSHVVVTDSLLIGMTTAVTGGGTPLYSIHFVDKASGRLLKTSALTAGNGGPRDIAVFTSNGQELMVAGSDYQYGARNGRFYMTMYNLRGERIFDAIDSAARLSTRRMHLMGSVFNQDGNLVLVGEGWKADATRAVAATAASFLLTAAVGIGPRVYMGLDHKVDQVVFATLSPGDGKLLDFRSFPVGPWYNYGALLTEGSHAMIQVGNQVISYDANDPARPPVLFTSLRDRESLVLTPAGPLINQRSGNYHTLRRVH